ncbi:plasma alpha-L-fucosidase [Magnaporthiopsis poae ATCC 64411]|uniref:alpha-L-fucosidase n=1 Tax=Magnaporthiopsis poae (strain ATCC 64411 / 73-15) TaxID=644358 RepID=A0A0C4DPV3_MAGP6|nr:plasma alpha-L-fucosidase [Magnaporthiopsis poae ATCC 64411]
MIFPGTAAMALAALLPRAAGQATKYEPTWESTDKHLAAPEWFRDAKFGVYWHWGAFTTPEYSSEWYPRDMYLRGNGVRAEHTRRYGEPEQWGYHNFILGAKDRAGKDVEFKPVLTSAGGRFDPAAWMKVVKASGARFAGPVAEHHDGFSMWNSSVNEWNSVGHGPKLDLLRLFAGLVRDNGMKLLVAMHHAFNTNGFYSGVPAQTSQTMKKLYGQLPRNESDRLWFDKHREMLDHVRPDIIYNDFSLDSPGACQQAGLPCKIAENERLNFLSYYFNRAEEWGKEVLTTYKHDDRGFRDTSAVSDWERGGPADIRRPYWLTDEAISASSWCYTVGIRYYSSKAMIHSLLDRVSKNGNMLLNISPTAAGVLPDEQQAVLRDIGDYLDRYGESVYDTRAWDIYGEGPNVAGGGLSGLKSVELLLGGEGKYAAVSGWKQNKDALVISLPTAQKPRDSFAYVLKLTFDKAAGGIPVPQPKLGASVFSEPAASGKGVSLKEGQFDTVFLTEAGLKPADIKFIRVSAGTKVTVFANGNLAGASSVLPAGSHVVRAGSVGSLTVARA